MCIRDRFDDRMYAWTTTYANVLYTWCISTAPHSPDKALSMALAVKDLMEKQVRFWNYYRIEDAAMRQDAPPAAFRAELAVPYENLLVYFLFRYALKAVNDRQLLPRVAACVFHLLCLRELLDDAGSETALCAAASLYSKEVEHSEENQKLLLKLFRRKTLTWQYLVSVLDA